ncbi:MAG: TonB-dependent receptor [Bacteroidales bacterium]|nr:TonB-dependent receptor [Bacteroidales bacterium]
MKISRLILLFVIAMSMPEQMLTGQHHAVSGFIIDKQTSETLIGANVVVEGTGKGVVTDRNGYFQMAGLPKGRHTLVFSYIGYESAKTIIEITDQGITLPDIALSPQSTKIEEVMIVAAGPDKVADRQIETSMIELSPKTIQSIPTARNDVFSAIKFLPGIDRTEPFSPLFTVRGGEPGENAVMLDGVMIYNPYHSSISSGIFNTQTIKSVDMLVGGFGAEFGGRNSSVMYISTKDGNSSGLHGEIEPSTFHSKAFLEFPVGEKGSAVVAGRYYFDVFSYFIMQSSSYFYDLNLSYTYRLNSKNRLTFKYFRSFDNNIIDLNTFYNYIDNALGWNVYDDLYFNMTNRWTNQAATIIHKWALNPRIFIHTQGYYSAHSSRNYSGFNFQLPEVLNGDTVYSNLLLKTSSEFINQITDLSAKTRINIKLARFSTFALGAEFNQYNFRNSASINEIDQGKLVRKPSQWSLFAENKIETGPLVLRPGIRYVLYNNEKWLYEPRVNMALQLPAKLKLRAAWGVYHQYVISMNTNEVEMNQAVDYYFPLVSYKPSRSVHYIAGLDRVINPATALSLDVYYKDIERIYTFDVNQTDVEVITLSDKLQMGRGDAYGAELTLRGAFKNLSGWCSYGLAWANRQYPFINNNRKYPYDYNRRHTLKMVANYALTKNLEYNVSFTYLSGTYRSIERVRQDYYYYDPVSDELGMFPIWISNEKNNARMPSLINLDMSIKKRLRSGFGRQFSDFINAGESYLVATIRNLTFFRRNVDYFFPVAITEDETKYLPMGTNYLPSVGFSYVIKF